MAKYLVLSIADAKRHDLVGCTCGHPENNHFDWSPKPCAHCGCKEYTLRARRGRLIDVPAIMEADVVEEIRKAVRG